MCRPSCRSRFPSACARATIRSAVGNGGARTLAAQLDNQGTLDVDLRLVRELVLDARQEPAIDVLARLAPLLMALPSSVLGRMIIRQTATQDLQASNVPGVAHQVYLAGARITHAYAFGPLPGCGAMITMTSHNGTGCLGVNVDPAAVTHPARLTACLREGFGEILGSHSANGL